MKLVVWDREGNANWSIDGVQVTFIRIRAAYGVGWRLVVGMLRWNWALLRHLWAEKPEIIHACDLDTVIPALVVKKLFGARVVYDIFDWYADSHPLGSLRSLVASLERWVTRHVDRVIIAHEARAAQLGVRAGSSYLAVVPIYNTPAAGIDGFKQVGPYGVSRPYVAYCGLLAADRGIEVLIRAAELCRIDLVIAGYGPLEEACSEWSMRYNNVHWLGRLPHREVLAIEAGAVAIVALYDPSIPNNRYAAPNKLFESMALGRPFITNDGTLAAELVRSHQCGIIVPYGDVPRLASAIQLLVGDPDQARRYGDNGLASYRAKYSADVIRSRLQELYKTL